MAGGSLFFIVTHLCARGTAPLSYDIDYFHMFTQTGSFPLFVSNVYASKLFVSARYSYDIQDVLCLNGGYIFYVKGSPDKKIIPTFGLLADRMTGVTPGMQINLLYPRLVVTSINQVMVDVRTHRYLNNAYNWNEFNYIVKDYFRPGIVTLEQFFWNNRKASYVSLGPTLFGHVYKFNYFIYSFDLWKNSRWFLIGFNYAFP